MRAIATTCASVLVASARVTTASRALLGSIPLDPALREAGDAGMPILEFAPAAQRPLFSVGSFRDFLRETPRQSSTSHA